MCEALGSNPSTAKKKKIWEVGQCWGLKAGHLGAFYVGTLLPLIYIPSPELRLF
jgi:hypothetical protein